MSVDRFEDTDRLDDAALHDLLAGGRAEQRVWAAWRVTLRVGGALPHIVGHVAGEPSAGVRRALLAVLAGYGEVDVLVALARHDPSVEVRSAAMQHVTRLAAQGAIAPVVVVEAFAGGTTEVRRAVLGDIPPGAPEALLALVPAALAQGAPGERLEAFEAALRTEHPAALAAALRWLEEARGELANEAWVLLGGRPVAQIVDLLANAGPATRRRALATLVGVPIAELAPLVDDDAHAFCVVRARHDFKQTPPEILARAVLAGLAVGFLERLAERLRPLDAAPPSLAPLLPPLRVYVEARLAALALNRTLPDERPPWRWPAVSHYKALRKQLERLA